ncbi:MAG: O-antigen ligase family protein [Bacteroidales bacterium]
MSVINPPSLFPQKIHYGFYLIGMVMIAISLPTSVYFISVGQFVLAGNWIIEGKYKDKVIYFWKQKTAVVFCLIFLLYLTGMLWSTDIDHGIRELRKKIPFLTLTFLIVSAPLGFNALKSNILLLLFGTSVLVSTFIGWVLFDHEASTNLRELSPFISHIRLSLMIVFSIFIFIWMAEKYPFPKSFTKNAVKYYLVKSLFYISSAWMLFFVLKMQVLTGLAALGAVVFFLSVVFIFQKKNRALSFIFITLLFLFVGSLLFMIIKFQTMIYEKDKTDLTNLPTHTSSGNPYTHNLSEKLTENGSLVYLYISRNELKEAWNERSDLDFDGKDLNGQILRYTIYRYMTSLGLKKDKEGMEKLTDEDIEAIEKGIANHYYTKWPGIISRIHQSVWEIYKYQNGYDSSEHSLAKRIEFWKASWSAIKAKPLFGWGTGDLVIAQHYGFKKTDSVLPKEQWNKPHNQFLTFAINFGIIGLSVIIYILFYVLKKRKKIHILPHAVFLVISFVSMLNEDTLENQAGLTFFLYFFLFFNFVYQPFESKNNKYI